MDLAGETHLPEAVKIMNGGNGPIGPATTACPCKAVIIFSMPSSSRYEFVAVDESFG